MQDKPKQITVQAYSIADALKEMQTYAQQGYEVDLETNGTYPMLIGSLMIFSVVLKDSSTEAEVTQEPAQNAPEQLTSLDSEELKEKLEDLVEEAVEAVQTVAKRGRPKASA